MRLDSVVLMLSILGACGGSGSDATDPPVVDGPPSMPKDPVDLIVNGPTQAQSTTLWYAQSFGFHRMSLYADGTGREKDGAESLSFTWQKVGPRALIINDCAVCRIRSMSEIEGSFTNGSFTAMVSPNPEVVYFALEAGTP